MKTKLNIVIAFLTCCISSGCWDRTEINDLALVTAIAFDTAVNNQVQISAQFFIPKSLKGSSGESGGGGGERQTIVRTEKGEDTADALSKLQAKIPRKLFWGQCKVFIFSENFAKKGIREQFDFLVRHPQPRERAFIFVSEGMASETLKVLPPLERTSATALRKLAQNKTGIGTTMEQVSIMLKGDSQSAIIPLIRILQPEDKVKSYETIPYIFGSAIFKKDKMVAEISEKETRGVMWIRNEIEEFTSTFKLSDGKDKVSLNPVKASVKLTPKIEGDHWIITMKVKTEGDIVQNGSMLNPMKPEAFKTIERAFNEDVRKRILLAIQVVQQEIKVDVLGFASEFHKKYPKEWEKVKNQWEDLFPKVEVRTEIEAYILRPGLTNYPGGIPNEEVEQ
ncbi:Ger(x)C family spore germination protein [Paenibacillus sp. 5J-6]|uniref:Ger(X)C family spore germination protein n=1 Tax=Paenibacillus silvestris TaxID=2606219 RepID=A0A6L8USL5_9BACL|nr:Ger(x)C family spore germination protein [Paenibacillus silvestris]MZQ81085.1 Ger(x)C family spore germination protein [Paenibacillus silvestris]